MVNATFISIPSDIVHRVSLLTDTQQSAIVDTLTAQLPSAEPSLKATILNSLEHLGVGRDGVVLSLLPFLVDHNVSYLPLEIYGLDQSMSIHMAHTGGGEDCSIQCSQGSMWCI